MSATDTAALVTYHGLSREAKQLEYGFRLLMLRGAIALVEGCRRAVDVIGALVGLVVFSPVMAAAALAIKLEDGGPVFFRQTRVGRWGRPFQIVKFRSMRVDAEAMKDTLLAQNETGAVTFKMKVDPRITKVGTWIRKLSIDEMPQFLNVVRGEMALVGPRPPVPREVALYGPHERRRLEVVPGITCIWQVSGRSDIPFDGQVLLDIRYIRSRSLWQDLRLLVATVPAVVLGRGAY